MSITLKAPDKNKGYASKDRGLGKLFALAIDSHRSVHFSNIQSYRKAGAKDRKNEVYQINKAFNESREDIAQSILKYLIENDGVVDAWPDPDTGVTLNFKLSDDNDSDRYISYDSYYYQFNYFASDYESDKNGVITGGGRAYRNPYKYKDTQRMRSIITFENNMLDHFKENNPLYFLWSLLVIFMMLLCFGGPLLSTAYLFFLQRAADPEVLELAVEGFLGNFDWIFLLFDKLPKFLRFILIILLFIPFALVMLLIHIPEMVCALAGKSVIVLVIYGLLLFTGGFMSFGMLYAFVGEKIPSAKPIDGLICLFEYIRSKFSKERKEAWEENERLREEYTELMEDFHRRWYNSIR